MFVNKARKETSQEEILQHVKYFNTCKQIAVSATDQKGNVNLHLLAVLLKEAKYRMKIFAVLSTNKKARSNRIADAEALELTQKIDTDQVLKGQSKDDKKHTKIIL